MKFKKVQVHGHQRSGTHFLAALIEDNILKTKNYLNCYSRSPHSIGRKKVREIVSNRDTAFIVVVRPADQVLKSVFNFRERLGLVCEDFDKFKNTPYTQMFKPGSKCKIILHTEGRAGHEIKKIEKPENGLYKSSSFFKGKDFTPIEWLARSYSFWNRCLQEHENVYMVSYSELISRSGFQKEMQHLGAFLGSNRKRFNRQYKKVGWHVKK